MDKITLVAVLTDYEETYDVRNVDKPEKESEETKLCIVTERVNI